MYYMWSLHITMLLHTDSCQTTPHTNVLYTTQNLTYTLIMQSENKGFPSPKLFAKSVFNAMILIHNYFKDKNGGDIGGTLYRVSIKRLAFDSV